MQKITRTTVILFLFTGTLFGATYYVDQSVGDDVNSGTTEALAWKTLNKVQTSTFSPGDTILFKRGEVWNETVEINDDGTAAQPVTFDAYGTGDAPQMRGFFLWEAPNIHVRNLHIHGNGTEDIPLLIQYADNALIEDVEVEHAKEINIFADTSSNIVLRRVHSHHAENQHGLYLCGGPVHLVNPVVEDSIFHDNVDMGIQLNDGSANRVQNPIIRRCIIYNNAMQINDLASENLLFYNNILYGTADYGAVYVGNCPTHPSGTWSSKNGKYYNNVIIIDAGDDIAVFTVDQYVTGLKIKNNCIYTADTPLLVYENGASFTADYNCYYAEIEEGWEFNWSQSFAQWQSSNGQDEHSVYANPQWINASNHDYHLLDTSPCIDAGTNVGVTTDFDDVLRPQLSGYDIGAYELIPEPASLIIIFGIAVIMFQCRSSG